LDEIEKKTKNTKTGCFEAKKNEGACSFIFALLLSLSLFVALLWVFVEITDVVNGGRESLSLEENLILMTTNCKIS
jgi:hypothetical protein